MNLKHKRIFGLFVKFVFCVSVIHAQNAVDSSKQKLLPLLTANNNIVFVKQPTIQNSLPGNFYSRRLPFFCNKELQVQKRIGFPLKFRLGSVEYCDKLEGKNNLHN
jgi:hypothetical protein